MGPFRVATLALLGAGGLLASCASSPHTLSWPADGTVAVARGDRIRTWPQAVSAVAAAMEGPLGLPPLEFRVSFYPTRGALEKGLFAEGYSADFARRAASTLDGVGIPRRVLLYEGALARASWTDRVAMLAHELTHVLQYHLAAGRRSTSEQWVREGFAEWVAARVLESLHLSPPGARRSRALRAVSLAGADRLPSLSELSTWHQWVDLRAARPSLPVYPYSHLAVDLLVERHGVEAVLDYFRRFAVSYDAPGVFAWAFGGTREELEAELGAAPGRR